MRPMRVVIAGTTLPTKRSLPTRASLVDFAALFQRAECLACRSLRFKEDRFMANYQTHITVSGMLGVTYGLAASYAGPFSGVHGALAGCLTGIAGMFPDLDSDSGRPVREVFGLVAAVAPLVLMNRLETWGGSHDGALLLAILVYVSIRYRASTLLNLVSVHRGM